jgi:competence protein ComEC
VRLPVPVFLWTLLLAGYGLALAVAVPGNHWALAMASACACGVASLAIAAWGRRSRPGRARLAEVAEAASACAALLCGGAALAAEADLGAWPLPVHPRPVSAILQGELLDTTAMDADPPRLLLGARSVEIAGRSAACRARVLLDWPRDAVPPRWAIPGLRLTVGGQYRPPEDARVPGVAAPGAWLAREGIDGVVDVDPRSVLLEGLRSAPGPGAGALLRHRLARALEGALSAPSAALARGMLLGDRSGIDASMRDAFRDAGTIHILSISGLHVCLLAGIVAFAAAALRLPRAAGAAVELAALWGYVALVGAPPPATRSAILWTSLRAGSLIGRIVRPLTAWGIAGLLLHLCDPAAPADPGFDLSFAAVLGLSVASGIAPRRGELRPTGTWGRAREWFGRALGLALQSLGAEAATLGIQAKLFGAVPIAGLLVNLAVVPICALFMAELVLFVGAAALFPPAANWAAGAAEATGLAQVWIAHLGAHWMPPWPVRAEPGWAALAGGLAALLVAAGRLESRRLDRRGAGRSRWLTAGALATAWGLPLLALPAACPPRDPAILFLDVGQGDAAAVLLADGTTVLIDAGPADDRKDAGRSAIEPALRAEGADRLDAALLSHAHGDHYGGMRWLARRGWLNRLLENGDDSLGAWRRDFTRPGGRGPDGGFAFVPLVRDTLLRYGPDASLQVWAATRPLAAGTAAGTGTNAAENDRSLIALLRVGGGSALFSGDVEREGENSALPRLARVDVLKVPHHGSRTSSAPAWVDALRPRVAIISCGERNRFGHPDRATVGRYLLAGARVLRTDREGTIRITFARGGLWISTRRSPAPEFVPRSRGGEGALDAPRARPPGQSP